MPCGPGHLESSEQDVGGAVGYLWGNQKEGNDIRKKVVKISLWTLEPL